MASLSPIQQSQSPKKQKHSEFLSDFDISDTDPMQQTILEYMKVDFQHCTALLQLNFINSRELNRLDDKLNALNLGIR